MVTPLKKNQRLAKGQKVWVRNNADKTWHPSTFDGIAFVNAPGPTVYNLKDCAFRWCDREDISTIDPNEKHPVGTVR